MNRAIPIVILILAITVAGEYHYLASHSCALLCSSRNATPEAPTDTTYAGGIGSAFDNIRIANILSRSGFVVAIPSYTTQKLFQALTPIFDAVQAFVQKNQDMGFACDANGQFVSAKLITSFLKFFLAHRGPHAGIRKSTNLCQTIIFGHTVGGAMSELLFSDVCKAVVGPVVPPPVPLAFDETAVQLVACEQFTPFRSQKVKVHGLVTYEGFTGNSTIDPAGTDSFYVVVHSSFFSDRVADFFGDREFNGRTAAVMMSNANHYAPTNFVIENENQKPVCARIRPPSEDMFTTTRHIQNKVIKSIARVTEASFDVYVRRKGRKTLRRLAKRRDLLVEKVRFL